MDETEAAVGRVVAMLTDTQTRPLAEFEAAIRREVRAARIRALEEVECDEHPGT